MNSKIVEAPKNLPVIIPGEDFIHVPDSFPAEGIVTPARQPQLIPAMPPGILKDAKFDIQYLDATHGLPDSYVYHVLEDKKGSLWFGTRSGLTRYDGKSFLHYSEKEGLPGRGILQIFEDSHGNLWLESRIKGIIKFDGYSFTFYDIKTNWIGDRFTFNSITEDNHGNIWIGALDGFYKFCPGKNDKPDTFIHYKIYIKTDGESRPCRVWSILKDVRGDIWMNTGGGGLLRFDGTTFVQITEQEGLSSNYHRGLFEDSKGRIWVPKDILYFDGEGNLTKIVQNSSGPPKLVEDDEGTFWYVNQIRAGYLDVSALGEITEANLYREIEGMSSNSLTSIMKDRQGHLWIGTAGGGVNRIDKKSFRFYTDKDGLSSKVVSSIAEDKNGHIWFGNETFENNNAYKTVSRFDNVNFYHYHGIQIPFTRDILKDKIGNMWFIHVNGITRFDYQSLQYYPTFSSNWIAFEEKNGGLWVSGGDVYRYNFDEEGKILDYLSFSHSPYLNSVGNGVLDRNGHMWFFNWLAGICRFESQDNWRTGTVTYFSENEGLTDNNAQGIAENYKGDLWIHTAQGGISFLSADQLESDKPHFINFKEEDGLSSNSVASIIEDHQKNIWVSTANGIDLFTPIKEGEQLEKESKIPGYKFFSFNHLDGLNQKSFSQRAVFKDSQNQIWWGSEDGATVLDIDQFSVPTGPPANIKIVNIQVDQQEVDFANLSDRAYQQSVPYGKALSRSFASVERFFNIPVNLSLPYHINHLTFYFSSIDWGAPHKIKYSYMIEGLNDDWSPLQSDPKADYRNLPPGKHTLKVKAIGEAQVWSDTFEYPFTIRPPWYWNIWSMAIYLLLIGLLIYWGYRYQLNRQLAFQEAKRLRELDEVKTKLYTNITHEFRTPLTIIKGMNQRIIESPEKWLREGTKMINRNSDRLLQLINQVLDLRKLESGKMKINMVQADVIPFLKYVLESFHSYAQQKDIQVHFISSLDECVMDYDPEKLQQIISNLMSNAIKFTKRGGNVYLIIEKVTGSINSSSSFALVIRVKDTGVGIPPEQLPRIFDRFYQVDDSATREEEGTGIGLAFTKALVESLNGEISVKSDPDVTSGRKGSEFIIHLPISNEAERVEKQPEAGGISSLFTSLVGSEFPVSASAGKKELPLALIVEDNADVVQYLISCLEHQYQLDVAKDGQEGIEKAIDLTPDIVISDVMMPRKDGFQLTEKLKTDLRTSHIPIILLTAKADVASKITGLQRGADVYLAKPFERQELLVRIEKLLELRRRLRKYYLSPFGEKPAAGEVREAFLEEAVEHQFVQRAREVVEQNLTNYEFRVSHLHEQLHMSHSNLHRKLKALTGFSSNEFIHHVRLEKAKHLLRHTDDPISNIGYDTGYKYPAQFSRAFRKEVGMSPSEFRMGRQE